MSLLLQQFPDQAEDRQDMSAEERHIAALEAIADSLSAIKLELTSFNRLYAANLRTQSGARG